MAERYRTPPILPASEPLENQGLQDPETEQSSKRRDLSFEQINEVTWKLTDGQRLDCLER